MDTTQAKDKICKRLFRHRRLVEDMLRAHVSGLWIREIDFRTLHLMPTKFVSRTGDRRFGDVLWVASLRDGRQEMVMIEIQSDVDSDMAARMAAYVGMVYESLTPAARGPNDRYPACGDQGVGSAQVATPDVGLAGATSTGVGRRSGMPDLYVVAR